MKRITRLVIRPAVIFGSLLGLAVIAQQPCVANTFYVDPVNGSMAGDGSAANPWSTLQNVFNNNLIESQAPLALPYNGSLQTKNPGAPVKAGDTIKLLNGHHGKFFAQGYYNQDTITIEAEAGHSPTLEGFQFQGGKNWTFRGLTISPELGGVVNNNSIVHFETHNFWGPASNFAVEDSTIYSVADSSAWSATDWVGKAAHGIRADGNNFSFTNNHIKNVEFGILTGGDDIVASGNTIENYSGDGLRGGGDRVTFENNTIKWSYDVDDNHDDAIQFFQGFGVSSSDVILRGNTIISYEDPARPLTHGAQGIGNFNGPYINWVVENNVVTTSTYHGISVYEAQDSLIVNNTVLDITGTVGSWIDVTNSTNTTVRNNLASEFKSDGATGLISDNNLTLNTAIQNITFEDWQNGDLRLKTNSPAIDSGNLLLAPTTDIEGKSRPIGDGIDLGAFEFSLAGDYNFDGVVDAADYSVWRDSLGSTSELAADGDGNGTVEQADYDVWKNNFGNPLSSTSTSQAVPEPSSGGLLFLALVAMRNRVMRNRAMRIRAMRIRNRQKTA